MSVISAVIIFTGISNTAMAFSVGVGFSGGAIMAEFDGKETMNQNNTTRTATEGANAATGSAYAQIIVGESMFGEGNGFALGYERFMGTANLDTHEGDLRNDLTTAAATVVPGRQYVAAQIEDLDTIFIETPGFTRLGIYLKAGVSSMSVITKEDLFSGGSYGDASIDGETYGFGFKKSAGGFQMKTEFSWTDWDDISLSNGAADAGASKIDVSNIENMNVKFGIGYNF